MHLRTRTLLGLGLLTLIVGFAGLYYAMLLRIESRAAADYEHLRTTGTFPAWTLGREPGAMTDGGTLFHDATGYRLLLVHRVQDPESGECLVGPQLVFTCRRWFPILHRRLEDRHECEVARCRE